MALIEKELSTFIEKQFPSFYRDEGPVFVAFVKEYYRWLEGQSNVATNVMSGSWVSVIAANTGVVGINTSFTTDVSNGQLISLYRDDHYYDIFTVDNVANDTYLTLTTSPSFSNTKTKWAGTTVERNVIYDSRRFPEYMDVDTTIDQFIVHFKNEYLSGIQFDTNSNIRMLLKHALDLYRAKGTPEAIKLLFRIVFGTDIDIYFPGDDLFKMSDGEWKIPQYIEIALSDTAPSLVNKQIVGSTSGATAFVDRAVRRQVNNRLTDILYISAIAGNFQTDELIDLADHSLDPSTRPVMIGSLTSVDMDVNGSGENFKVGDIVDIYSDLGSGGVGRVSNTVDSTGALSYVFNYGGYGYETGSNTIVAISDNILSLSNVTIDQVTNPWINSYTEMFETFYQPQATFGYTGANGTLTAGMNIYTYSNNVVTGVGKIMVLGATSISAGTIRASIISGNIHANQFYTDSNTIVATQTAYSDISASGNVYGETANLVLTVSGVMSTLSVGDTVYQYDTTGSVSVAGVVSSKTNVGSNVAINIENANGVFVIGRGLYNNSEVYYGNTTNISIQIGVKLIGNNVFLGANGALIYGLQSNTSATLLNSSFGTGANITLSDTLLNTEEVALNVDYLDTYQNTFINGAAYGFPADPSGDVSTSINACMTAQTVTIGQLSGIITFYRGVNYSQKPIILIMDEQIGSYYKYDYMLTIQGSSGIFAKGEVITQASTGARGMVLDANDSIIHLQRLNFASANDFIDTVDGNTVIIGSSTGFTANVMSVDVYDDGEPIGYDANVSSQLTVSNGAITELQVLESGFGFLNNQDITIVGNVGTTNASGIGITGKIGQGHGYYRSKGGFLSDQKKLQDGYYWQNYSYDVRSSVALDKYKEMLRQIVHVAGTINFATLITRTTSGIPLNTQGSVLTLS